MQAATLNLTITGIIHIKASMQYAICETLKSQDLTILKDPSLPFCIWEHTDMYFSFYFAYIIQYEMDDLDQYVICETLKSHYLTILTEPSLPFCILEHTDMYISFYFAYII